MKPSNLSIVNGRNEKKTLKVSLITTSNEGSFIAKKGFISHINSGGFRLTLHHHDLVISSSKTKQLNFLLHQHIWMYLPLMEIDLDGRVQYIRCMGEGAFQLYINCFTQPPYWYECFCALWRPPLAGSILL